MPTDRTSAPNQANRQDTALRQRKQPTAANINKEIMVPRIEMDALSSHGNVEVRNSHTVDVDERNGVKDDSARTVQQQQQFNGDVVRDTDQGGGPGPSITLDTDDQDVEIETSFTEPLLQRPAEDDGDSSEGGEVAVIEHREESSLSITIQVFLPFIIAGLGTVGAGLVLDIVQHWPVYIQVTEVFILVPALLGLKGNLEMTLASRLSTAANLGNIDDSKEQWQMIFGNMALTQCQALVVGFLASIAAAVMGYIPDGEINLYHILLLCASSMVTASLASAILGSIMVVVVFLSKRCHINPDNVATPIAASLGDLITLALLSWITSLLFRAIGDDDQTSKKLWLAPCIIVSFFVLLPLWVWLSHRNKYTHDVLHHGWTPVIAAMMISSCGGLVLDVAIRQNAGVAVFSPVINGVGGNLVAVQADINPSTQAGPTWNSSSGTQETVP